MIAYAHFNIGISLLSEQMTYMEGCPAIYGVAGSPGGQSYAAAVPGPLKGGLPYRADAFIMQPEFNVGGFTRNWWRIRPSLRYWIHLISSGLSCPGIM